MCEPALLPVSSRSRQILYIPFQEQRLWHILRFSLPGISQRILPPGEILIHGGFRHNPICKAANEDWSGMCYSCTGRSG